MTHVHSTQKFVSTDVQRWCDSTIGTRHRSQGFTTEHAPLPPLTIPTTLQASRYGYCCLCAIFPKATQLRSWPSQRSWDAELARTCRVRSSRAAARQPSTSTSAHSLPAPTHVSGASPGGSLSHWPRAGLWFLGNGVSRVGLKNGRKGGTEATRHSGSVGAQERVRHGDDGSQPRLQGASALCLPSRCNLAAKRKRERV